LDDVTLLVERSLDKFNGEMERVLSNRKQALDSLISDASKRATEIDSVMTSYMNLIEDSLAASESKAKEISRIIAEQTTVANRNLEQEIEKLGATSGGQISQAARVLKDQHERAMAAMNEMLSSTATDFQQTAQDMRLTAQQVVKDIDIARSELKRAILDLPEETRSNADAMRRVVADQINALNALADVVKRQTGNLDISGPGVQLTRSYRDPSPGKAEGAMVPAPHGTMSALGKLAERSEKAVESLSVRERLAAATGRSPEATAPAMTPASAPAPASAPVPVQEAPAPVRSKALPELSKDMEGLVQKLNAAARDIVEAADGGLPRDLEKRYSAGDASVYTRRLFEGRGKRLQRQLADRYGGDRLIRSRVDSFVRLFERLLDTMNAAPAGDMLVEACLASESGRIYVMLAEIAGRIPPQN
jgi:hypothetical protein